MQRLLLAMALLCSCAYADKTNPVRSANLEFVNTWHTANLKAAADSPDLHVLPRVLIDKANSTVSFYAEATGIELREPVEFFLIGEQSGNAYESIAVALAAPADIAAAIRMIGLPEGRSSNPTALKFWPKGERVIMTFNGRRAEQLLLDARTGKTLPESGFVYTASSWVPAEDGRTTSNLAAQVRHPFAIAANYNEADALLDVPWQAPQTAVYSQQTQNPDTRFKAGERVLITITPEYKAGKKRVQDLQLTLDTATTNASTTIADARFTLKHTPAGDAVCDRVTIEKLLAAFSGMIDKGFDPFVEIHIRPEVPLAIIQQTAAILKSIDTEKGVRIEPPPAGELYYQAFTPNEEFRSRQSRYMQPWELRFKDGEDATLTRIDENWVDDKPKPEIKTEDIPVPTSAALRQVLATQNIDVRGIYVFAPPSLAYGKLMQLVGPVLETHPNIHVYVDKGK